MPKQNIIFCTGVSTVTGANFILDTGKSRILIDCGMIQGERVAQQANYEPFTYDISTIDALIITHAHLDHVGRIPKLVKEGYQGPIYSTPETRELADVVLHDAAGIIAMEAQQNGMDPMYELSDVQTVFSQWKTIP
ncbi:MAG: MBL fold metallo-hydrolase, partial [bacterium]|nr:MBL fold metallo-hydrolase [bacterium]